MIHSRGLIIEGKNAKSETETKSARLLEVKFSDAKPGEFECYMSIFGNEDEGGDVVAPGAFKGTLASHKTAGTMPKMLLNHGSQGGMFSADPMADLPIGIWRDISEDSKGLLSAGRLINLDTDRGRSIYGAVKEGALDGVSIGYRAKDYTLGAREGEPRRTLKAVDLIEASLVTFPMNKLATITNVKGALEFDPREMEEALRDGGLSQRHAVMAVSIFRKMLRRDVGEPKRPPRDEDGIGEANDLLRSLESIRGSFLNSI